MMNLFNWRFYDPSLYIVNRSELAYVDTDWSAITKCFVDRTDRVAKLYFIEVI